MNVRPQNLLFHSIFILCNLSTAFSAKPNVVFIMADDLGWADTTLYGHTALYETPNLERLAKRG
ncbi:MAG: sulfatase-like hydrolase/transferase, partial [Opitutales bacterium]